MIKNGRPVREEAHFEVHLRMQYYNRGDAPLIVPTPRFFLRGKQLQFFDIPSSDSKTVANSKDRNYSAGKDWIKSLSRILEQPDPPIGYFAIIEPGSTFETVDLIKVTSGFRIETLSNADKRVKDIEIARPEHPYLTVRYSAYLKDKTATSNNPTDAQLRWKRFGKLILNADGEFYLETEIIINKLPD